MNDSRSKSARFPILLALLALLYANSTSSFAQTSETNARLREGLAK